MFIAIPVISIIITFEKKINCCLLKYKHAHNERLYIWQVRGIRSIAEQAADGRGCRTHSQEIRPGRRTGQQGKSRMVPWKKAKKTNPL